MDAKLGFELELLVLDSSYNETNNADLVINKAKERGISITTECSHSMVEINSIPGTIDEAANDMLNQLDNLNKVAKDLDLIVLPIEMPLNHNFKTNLRDTPRYFAKKELLGEERFEISGKVMGFHVHYDLPSCDELKLAQINFLKIVDPLVISASASSPHNFGGVDYNSWRTHSYRYIVHEDLPFQGQLQKFSESYEKYVEEHLQKYKHFLEISNKKNIDFSQYADEYNSIWGPTRINPIYNTSEIRSIGSTPDINLLFGLASIIHAGIKKINQNSNTNNIYLEMLSEIKDPNETYNFIQALSDDSIKYGFNCASVKNYSESLIQFCNDSLTPLESKFANYCKNMVLSGNNFSDLISNNSLSNQEKYKLLHNHYVESIKYSKQILEEK